MTKEKKPGQRKSYKLRENYPLLIWLRKKVQWITFPKRRSVKIELTYSVSQTLRAQLWKLSAIPFDCHTLTELSGECSSTKGFISCQVEPRIPHCLKRVHDDNISAKFSRFLDQPCLKKTARSGVTFLRTTASIKMLRSENVFFNIVICWLRLNRMKRCNPKWFSSRFKRYLTIIRTKVLEKTNPLDTTEILVLLISNWPRITQE